MSNMIFPQLGQWRTFPQIYSTGVARVPTVVSGAFYYRLDVCNLCKLLFQTQFIFNYPTIIIFYLHSNIPQVNNTKSIVLYNIRLYIPCSYLTFSLGSFHFLFHAEAAIRKQIVNIATRGTM